MFEHKLCPDVNFKIGFEEKKCFMLVYHVKEFLKCIHIEALFSNFFPKTSFVQLFLVVLKYLKIYNLLQLLFHRFHCFCKWADWSTAAMLCMWTAKSSSRI